MAAVGAAAKAAPAALMARKMEVPMGENILNVDWMADLNQVKSGYVQATAPPGSLTYTSANLGI